MKKNLSLLSISTALLLGLSAFQASAQDAQTPSADAPSITQDVKLSETVEAAITSAQEQSEKEASATVPKVEETVQTTADTTTNDTATPDAVAPAPQEEPAQTAQEEVSTPAGETPVEDIAAPEEALETAPAQAAEPAVTTPAVEETITETSAQPAKAAVKSPLTGTTWGLVRIESGDGTVLKPNYAKNFAITFVDDKTVTVRINCNNGKSSWTEKEDQALELAPLAMTRKACPTASPIDERMFKDWEYVRHYSLTKGILHMSLQADAGTYEFKPLKK